MEFQQTLLTHFTRQSILAFILGEVRVGLRLYFWDYINTVKTRVSFKAYYVLNRIIYS
jgi:hypothetical protein